MDPTAAEIVAIQALGFLAGEPDRLGRFLKLTGARAETLKQQAEDQEFLAGVLEYLLTDESLLYLFAEAQGLRPEDPARALSVLSRVAEHAGVTE